MRGFLAFTAASGSASGLSAFAGASSETAGAAAAFLVDLRGFAAAGVASSLAGVSAAGLTAFLALDARCFLAGLAASSESAGRFAASLTSVWYQSQVE